MKEAQIFLLKFVLAVGYVIVLWSMSSSELYTLIVPRPALVHGTISTVPALSAVMFHVDWEVFGHLCREP